MDTPTSAAWAAGRAASPASVSTAGAIQRVRELLLFVMVAPLSGDETVCTDWNATAGAVVVSTHADAVTRRRHGLVLHGLPRPADAAGAGLASSLPALDLEHA